MMNDAHFRKVLENFNKNFLVLSSAFQEAGGAVSSLEEMSLHDFLVACSTNSIELGAKYVGPGYEKEEQD